MPEDSADLSADAYHDGVGEEMTDEEVREMLEVCLLDGWDALYRNVDVTLHRDGGATIHLKLDDDHIRGLSEGW